MEMKQDPKEFVLSAVKIVLHVKLFPLNNVIPHFCVLATRESC